MLSLQFHQVVQRDARTQAAAIDGGVGVFARKCCIEVAVPQCIGQDRHVDEACMPVGMVNGCGGGWPLPSCCKVRCVGCLWARRGC